MTVTARPRLFRSARGRRRFLVHALGAGLADIVLLVLIERRLGFLANLASVQGLVVGFGLWAPAVFVVLQATQVVVAPIPR